MDRRLGPPSACRSCGRAVYWVTWRHTGSRMQIDAEPVLTGDLAVSCGGREPLVWKASAEDAPGPRFVSHFATCPDAARWRRRGASTTNDGDTGGRGAAHA